MRYLIFSDAASMHVYNFIRFFLIGKNYEITILRHSVHKIPEQYQQFYDEHGIKVITPSNRVGHKGLFISTERFISKVKFLKQYGKADVCHIHYANSVSSILYLLFTRNFNRLIITFWGTDILRPPRLESFLQKKILPYANKITVTVKNSYNVFQRRFGHKYDDKLEVVHFPSGGVPKIKEISEKMTREECRKEMRVPDGKLLLVCGYNADPAQRQDICLHEISLLKKEDKDKVHVLVPLQYSRIDMNYIKRVKEAAQTCGCSYVILEEYVPFERNAIMCLATDIYLNLRTSDAFSNAMKEQVAAGSLMIQGNWLRYIEVDEMKAPVIKINNLSELHGALSDAICQTNLKTEHRLFMPMYKLFAPESLKNEWDRIFKKLDL